MRIRTVKPEFWGHEEMSTVSAESALLALGLLNYADDEGYFNANPKLIQAALFPLRECSMTIPGMLMELSRVEWIEVRATGTGKAIGLVINFTEHQVISRPRRSDLRKAFEGSVNDHGGINEGSQPKHGGMEGKGTGNGKEQGTGNARKRGGGRAQGIAPEEQSEPLKSRLLAIGALLRRQPSTVWIADEFEAFKAAGLESIADGAFEDQLAPMAMYYAAKMPVDGDFRRRDVLRLLRNWPGELDKARAWSRDNHDGLKKM